MVVVVTFKEPKIRAFTHGVDSFFQLYTITSWDQVTGIETALGVTYVHLQDCALPDIEQLLALPEIDKVTTIGFVRCDIGSLDAIGSFPSLQHVFINGCTARRVPDVHPLADVKEFVICGCPVGSLIGMDKFPNVEILNVDSTPITSFEGLEGCPNVKTISARFCTSLGSLRGLQNATKLEKLNITMHGVEFGGNIREPGRLTSLHGLEHCEALVEIDATGHRIESLAGLGKCGMLEKANLTHNRLVTTAGLDACEWLKELHVGNNAIERIEGMEPLGELAAFSLRDNPLASLKGIEPLRESLWALDISRTRVRSLAPLQGFTGIREFYGEACRFTSLAPLGDCSWLHALRVSGSPVTSLAPLAHMQHLSKVHAAGCKLTRLDFPACRRCDELVVDGNQIAAVRVPGRVRQLAVLNIAGNPVSSFVIEQPLEPFPFVLRWNIASAVSITEFDLPWDNMWQWDDPEWNDDGIEVPEVQLDVVVKGETLSHEEREARLKWLLPNVRAPKHVAMVCKWTHTRHL